MKRTTRTIPAIVLAASLAASGGLVLATTAGGASAAGTINADKLDGMNSTEFAYAKGKTRAFDVSGEHYDLDEDGYDDVIAAYAQCPAGTQLTGGGGGDFTATGIYLMSLPTEGEGWLFAVWIDETYRESASNVLASILCYSPHGKTFSGSYRAVTPRISEATMTTLRRAAERRSK